MVQTNKIIFQQLEAKNHQSNSRFYKSRIKMFHFVVTQGLPCNNYTSIALEVHEVAQQHWICNQ